MPTKRKLVLIDEEAEAPLAGAVAGVVPDAVPSGVAGAVAGVVPDAVLQLQKMNPFSTLVEVARIILEKSGG